jgi:hypothetical protein
MAFERSAGEKALLGSDGLAHYQDYTKNLLENGEFGGGLVHLPGEGSRLELRGLPGFDLFP